jgi:hypothetical protein
VLDRFRRALARSPVDRDENASCAHASPRLRQKRPSSLTRRSATSFARLEADAELEKVRATCLRMTTLSRLTDAQLLRDTRLCLQRAHVLDAELLLLLGEVDSRQLFAERAFPSMFAFCTSELGFSEDVACNRIAVARLARRFPRVLDFVRSGQVHLTGLRLLAAHLDDDNLENMLASAVGKTKREVEELVARLAPQPHVPPSIRKLPERAPAAAEPPPLLSPTPSVAPPPAVQAEVKPLAAEAYKVAFTADRALKAKLERAEELMRHRVGRGNLAAVIDRALDLLIEEVTKERFGKVRAPRTSGAEAEQRSAVSRHIPDAIKREVHERDGGRCAFVSEEGRRCEERGGLEFEHRDGFARTGRHTVAGLALFCRTHNQHAADKLYGRRFMEAKRRIRPGTDSHRLLL